MKAAFLAFLLVVVCADKAPPTWPAQYIVSGLFSIPYFDISEPIVAYYDQTNNRQRFDYYGGMDTYIWRWDLQTLYEQIPRIDDMKCFISTGIGSGPMVQILPNLSNWTYAGEATVRGVSVDNWQKIVTNGNTTATYNFYFEPVSGTPIQLLMQGYDFVFGSHPDIYIMNYDDYQPNQVDGAVFEEPLLCSQNGTVLTDHRHAHRAKALLGKLSAATTIPDLNDELEHFSFIHKKFFATEERDQRKSVLKKTKEFIATHNAQNPHFKVGLNQFAAYTEDEMEMLYRPKIDRSKAQKLSKPVFTHERSSKQLPAYVNWVEKGAVNPPKDQGVCGSCWTFGTVGSIEGVWAATTGNLVSLSEQQLVDCAWGPWIVGNSGCDGGFAGPAMQWVQDNGGMALESAYPYLMVDSFCNSGDRSGAIVLKGYVNVTATEAALQDAVATVGPVAVAIDASHPAFTYYTSGVYYQPDCGNTVDQLDHEVLVVGYGTENGEDYWLVKNSWSTHWGDQGYVKMARNQNNNCGIATQTNYPLIKPSHQ